MQIKIRKSFLVYLIVTALLSSPSSVFAMVFALAVHESGHILAGYLIGEPMRVFELTPFGGILRCDTGNSACKGMRGVISAVSGPAANYLFLMILGLKPVYRLLGNPMTRKLMAANASMVILNLLPALPLDGGRVLLSIGFYFIDMSVLINILSYLGCLAGIAIFGLALYGLAMHGILNCSLAIIGVYIAVCALSSRSALICENAYSVIQERAFFTGNIRKTRVISAEKDTPVIALLPVISRAPSALLICRDGENSRFIFEHDLLAAILEKPNALLGTVREKTVQQDQKNQGN